MMKLKTLERRTRERMDARKRSHAELIRRLKEQAAQCGPDSIWQELLDEANQNQQKPREV